MKTFHYPLGHEQMTTMTVGELKATLGKYPDDMPVLAEWEGQYMPIRDSDDNISVQNPTHWLAQDNVPCLVLDVNGY